MKSQKNRSKLVSKIIRDYPDEINVEINGVTFVFKPIRDASAVWLARKTAQELASDTEKGRTSHLWGDLTPESGDVVFMASILSQFCIKIKGMDENSNELEEVPDIKDFLFIAKNDCQLFAQIIERFYNETSFKEVSSNEMSMIEDEKKI